MRLRGLIRYGADLDAPLADRAWQGEMRRKFSLDLISHDDPAFRERGPAAGTSSLHHRFHSHRQARAAPIRLTGRYWT